MEVTPAEARMILENLDHAGAARTMGTEAYAHFRRLIAELALIADV